MFRSFKLFCVGVLVCFTAACSVPKIDTTPEALSSIKTVAVIRPPQPKTFAVINFGHPGVAFGLIGGLIAAADQTSKQEELAKVLKGQNITLSSVLAEGLVARLNQRGFEARVEDGPWEESEGTFKLPFEKIESKADAVLVVAPTIVGFIATGVTSDYIPTVTSVVTLLGKDRKEPMYRGFHASGWQPKADGWTHTPAKTTFPNFEALMANPGKTAGSLNDAVSAVASTIANDFRR